MVPSGRTLSEPRCPGAREDFSSLVGRRRKSSSFTLFKLLSGCRNLRFGPRDDSIARPTLIVPYGGSTALLPLRGPRSSDYGRPQKVFSWRPQPFCRLEGVAAAQRKTWSKRGLALDENDLCAAVTPLALGATLVSRDRDFTGIDDLRVVAPVYCEALGPATSVRQSDAGK